VGPVITRWLFQSLCWASSKASHILQLQCGTRDLATVVCKVHLKIKQACHRASHKHLSWSAQKNMKLTWHWSPGNCHHLFAPMLTWESFHGTRETMALLHTHTYTHTHIHTHQPCALKWLRVSQATSPPEPQLVLSCAITNL
jgi:hypothetical protein